MVRGPLQKVILPGLSGQLMVHPQGSDLSFTQALLRLSPVVCHHAHKLEVGDWNSPQFYVF